ncbi:MAG: bifunctional DNA-formamidopyrimidine glycosylase/DNA-(apurinic or apyrimidinic site) lyase [Bacillota bacterium]
MPELPEVETISRQLAAIIPGRTIRDAEVRLEKVVREPAPAAFAGRVRGRKITGVSRRGKYLLLELNDGHTLVIHLRMSGQLVYEEEAAPLPRHTHLVLHLDRGRLRLTDLRQFGRVWLLPAAEAGRMPELTKLGPEPFSAAFSEAYLAGLLRNSRRRLKLLLLDQEVVAGIGNIYADEILFQAGLHPARRGAELSAAEVKRLYRAIKAVLADGVAHRGTSIQNYVDGEGRMGTHQNFLRVHHRAGQPCPRCGTRVEKIKFGGRGTYFCPGCQVVRVRIQKPEARIQKKEV